MENLEEAVKIISKIEELGYTAVIVGGAVRDRLLGLSSYDIDIATSMPINELSSYFETIDNGSSYLSITINMNGNLYEVTSFRKDISYSDHRHPEVEYVDDFFTDSKRRDFTINALAYDKNLKVIDYHNGLDDLNKRLIRTIGDPNARFNEDALRILRALYLASKLDFSIESKTLLAIIDNKRLLAALSNERILPMLYRIINAKYDRGIEYINKYDLFEYIPIYKNMLKIAKRGLSPKELIYAYYIKFNRLDIKEFTSKAIITGLKNLLDNNFSIYSLYNNTDTYFEVRHTLLLLGYDINKYDCIIDSFIIKSDRELAVSKAEISSYFEGKEKSIIR